MVFIRILSGSFPNFTGRLLSAGIITPSGRLPKNHQFVHPSLPRAPSKAASQNNDSKGGELEET